MSASMVTGWLAALAVWGAADVSLQWHAPPGCPDEVALQQRIEPLVAADAQGSVRGTVTRTGGGYSLRMSITTRKGEQQRTIEAASCTALTQAAAVVVAVAVDPVRVATEPAAVPEPVSEPVASRPRSRPTAEVTRTPATPPSHKSTRPRVLLIGAWGGAGVGVVPRVHGTIAGVLGAQWSRFEVVAAPGHRFSTDADAPTGGGAAISTYSLSVLAGPVLGAGRLRAHFRVGVDGGAMVAVGQGLDRTRTAVSPWVAATAQPGVSVELGSVLALNAGVTFTAALTRPQFALDPGPVVHQTGPLGVGFGLGAEFRIARRQPGLGRRPRE